jgi:hypothetical protein
MASEWQVRGKCGGDIRGSAAPMFLCGVTVILPGLREATQLGRNRLLSRVPHSIVHCTRLIRSVFLVGMEGFEPPKSHRCLNLAYVKCSYTYDSTLSIGVVKRIAI